MKFTLPELGYNYSDLEPFIDAQTMEIHYSKHHQGYIDKLNAALENYPDWQNKTLEDLLVSLNDLPQDIKIAVKNNAGGHFNHSFFWPLLKKNNGEIAQGELLEKINGSFTSFDNFKEKFNMAATTLFGSGWAWLVVTKENKLEVIQTTNQDCPVSLGLKPILGLDVWEHAYYLKYQNKRPDYLNAFWNVINWQQVQENLNK
jgi:Fe-Mn family superoxide dismutase